MITTKNKVNLIRFGGIRLHIFNWFFKNCIGVNKSFKDNIHFTSQVIGDKIKYHRDHFTLRSFKTSSNCYIQCLSEIYLGKNLLFASGLKIISTNHDSGHERKTVPCEPIVVGDNCWFGANVVILPGVRVGNNCIIGAGSIVTKSFENDNLTIVGNPARNIA